MAIRFSNSRYSATPLTELWKQDAGSGIRQLGNRLIEIENSRLARERQSELDRLAEEERQRRAKLEEDEAIRRVQSHELNMLGELQKLDKEAMAQADMEALLTEPSIKKLMMPDPSAGLGTHPDERRMLQGLEPTAKGSAGALKSPMIEMEMADEKPVTTTLPSGREYTAPSRDAQMKRARMLAEVDKPGTSPDVLNWLISTQQAVLAGEEPPPPPEGMAGIPNAGVQALMQNIRPSSSRAAAPKIINRKDGTWLFDTESGKLDKLIGPQPGKEDKLEPIPVKEAMELADMRTMALKAQDLMSIESGAEFVVSEWTPEAIRSILAERELMDTDKLDDTFFAKSATLKPQYFLFAAEMLKAMQGSRPSDKDMAWYLDNLPRVDLPEEVNRKRIRNIIGNLGHKYNSRLDALDAIGRDISKFPKMDVDLIMQSLEGAEGTAELPPGFVVNE